MRNLLIIFALAVASAFVLACAKTDASANAPIATNATPDPRFSPAPVYTAPEPAAAQEDAPRISLADAKKDYDDGTAVIIDARAEDIYKDEHIKGAINITSETLKEKIKDLPKNKTIIVYCS